MLLVIVVPSAVFLFMTACTGFLALWGAAVVIVGIWGGLIPRRVRKVWRSVWGARRERLLARRKKPSPIEAMVAARTQWRTEEHQTWSNQYEELAGHHWSKLSSPAPDKPVRLVKIASHADGSGDWVEIRDAEGTVIARFREGGGGS